MHFDSDESESCANNYGRSYSHFQSCNLTSAVTTHDDIELDYTMFEANQNGGTGNQSMSAQDLMVDTLYDLLAMDDNDEVPNIGTAIEQSV